MASPSDSRGTTSDETEVTSKQQNPDFHHHNYNGEVRSAAAMGEQLAGQSSIYSLTLDEIQNTVCGPGKPFGSMNMDEFLANIWSAEEANAAAPDSSAAAAAVPPPPLLRQASLTLPPPLSGKTVDEVWAEIHRDRSHNLHHHHQQQQQQPFLPQQTQARRAAAAAAEPPNFGEMTLEDFLIKAGVVKEDYAAATPAPATPAPYGYQIGAAPEAAGYGAHVIGVGYGGGEHAPPAAVNGYAIANGKSDAVAAAAYGGGNICFGGGGARIGNGYGSATSPVSEDGQVDNAAGPYGGGGGGGRKRGAEEATVEKVVERRQRRMIKNRESAARSRARKQAYTVELEAELNQLKEENARLKAEEKRILALWKQMILQTMSDHARANAAKTVPKLRRCNSMPL